jgi:BirA family biotin operon repressor/biotin-[acetyl-CoA-carboxylase] ligase
VDFSPVNGLPNYRHLSLEEVVSTNSEALALARRGEPGNLWVSAERQSGGRGRRGREWVSRAGNLYASLLLTDPGPASALANLPFVAAAAVHSAVDRFFADRPVRPKIKWPNDILVGNEKLVGILLESEQLPGKTNTVVIGFGINCRHHPENVAMPATDLQACGIMVEPAKLFPILAGSMDRALSVWDRGRGFSAIRRQWLDAAQGLGERVKVNLHEGVFEGYFNRIDDDGYLILRLDDGNFRRISAGDLFFYHAEGVKT